MMLAQGKPAIERAAFLRYNQRTGFFAGSARGSGDVADLGTPQQDDSDSEYVESVQDDEWRIGDFGLVINERTEEIATAGVLGVHGWSDYIARTTVPSEPTSDQLERRLLRTERYRMGYANAFWTTHGTTALGRGRDSAE